MSAPATADYRRAALLALAWVTVGALLAFGAGWLRPRFDPNRIRDAELRFALLGGFSVLPFAAGGCIGRCTW